MNGSGTFFSHPPLRQGLTIRSWLQTHKDLPASASRGLETKVCVFTPGSPVLFKNRVLARL